MKKEKLASSFDATGYPINHNLTIQDNDQFVPAKHLPHFIIL